MLQEGQEMGEGVELRRECCRGRRVGEGRVLRMSSGGAGEAG